MASDKKKIYYDYVIVTGKKYIEVFKDHLKDPDGNILDLGYPRNEFFTSTRSNAAAVLEKMKQEAGADKVIFWLPTYRKSTVARLDSDTAMGETGLPILYNNEDIERFNDYCRSKGVLIILKQHILQSNYSISGNKYCNILSINDHYLKEEDADLYEMLAHSDALLTDYSSVAIDYMLLDKPIGYTLDDYDKYEAKRGFSFDNVKDFMPGHHIYTVEDMKKYICGEGMILFFVYAVLAVAFEISFLISGDGQNLFCTIFSFCFPISYAIPIPVVRTVIAYAALMVMLFLLIALTRIIYRKRNF
jgi:CDP-glycerol glycerophosphotransferase (TagB/SpsB family)